MKYKTIMVFLEMEDGTVRQVLASKEQKELALGMLVSENGSVKVLNKEEPFYVDRT